jgi:hypothetical protein
MKSLLARINGYRRLGLANLLRVFFYKCKLKSGLMRRSMPIVEAIPGPFFSSFKTAEDGDRHQALPSVTIPGPCKLFGWYELDLAEPPKWHCSLLNQQTLGEQHKHWTEISDFDSGVGDIKGVWELSRFSWALNFIQAYMASGDALWLDKLNYWLADWSKHNPANQGANWKCAQEASLRIIHLASVALLSGEKAPSAALTKMIEQHLARVFPTLGYAMAQDNNHGTSEAAALYIGGSWLLQTDPHHAQARRWHRHGYKYLHNRVLRLVETDGSFSQYSLTYHRLLLDTLSMVELWRRFLSLVEFNGQYKDRVSQATRWLFAMVDTSNGDAPNLGANDGAQILNFSGAPYRDFRPSVELASQLFMDSRVFDTEHCHYLVRLFSLDSSEVLKQKPVSTMPDGGYGVLRHEQAWCMLKVPNYRFRPSHADCLHLDLWVKGINLCRDDGSYSYNTEGRWLNYFGSTEAHNTVQFDHRGQMPKVSRFLFAHWAEYEEFNVQQQGEQLQAVAAYRDWQGARHKREVLLRSNSLEVTDTLSGIKELATLRWRLPQLDWQLAQQSVSNKDYKLVVSANQPLLHFELAQGNESRYYGQKEAIALLELSIAQDGIIKTIITWQ